MTVEGIKERLTRMKAGLWIMAFAAWGAVITGTFIVYPWYRDAAATSPKSLLLANAGTALWHNFGMEWKEHVGWIAPIAATVVAFIVMRYGSQLKEPTMTLGEPTMTLGESVGDARRADRDARRVGG